MRRKRYDWKDVRRTIKGNLGKILRIERLKHEENKNEIKKLRVDIGRKKSWKKFATEEIG